MKPKIKPITLVLRELYDLEMQIATLELQRDDLKSRVKEIIKPDDRMGPVYDSHGGMHYLTMHERVDKVLSPRLLWNHFGPFALRYLKVNNTLLKDKQPGVYDTLWRRSNKKSVCKVLRWS